MVLKVCVGSSCHLRGSYDVIEEMKRLIKKYGVSPAQITRLKRNESVSTHTINMFCRILRCQVGDIMQYVEVEDEQ